MVKLITHTDLDGIGCAVLAKIVFGEDVDITYTDYDKVNEVMANLNEKEYDKVFMTDISCDEEYLYKVSFLFDHHPRRYSKEYDNINIILAYTNGVLACGTTLFADFLEVYEGVVFTERIKHFIRLVRTYDTWDWTKSDYESPYQLNQMLSLMGRDLFIQYVVETDDYLIKSELIQYEEQRETFYVNNKLEKVRKVELKNYSCGVVFAESYFSALGEAICKEHDVAVMIDMSKECVHFRSKGADVRELAQKLGGGGHLTASGAYYVKLQEFETLIQTDIWKELMK